MHMLHGVLTHSLLGLQLRLFQGTAKKSHDCVLTLLSCDCPLVQTASRLMPPGNPFAGAELIAFSVNSSFARCSTTCKDQTQ